MRSQIGRPGPPQSLMVSSSGSPHALPTVLAGLEAGSVKASGLAWQGPNGELGGLWECSETACWGAGLTPSFGSQIGPWSPFTWAHTHLLITHLLFHTWNRPMGGGEHSRALPQRSENTHSKSCPSGPSTPTYTTTLTHMHTQGHDHPPTILLHGCTLP